MAKQLKDNVWIRLPKQVTFQFLTKCCEDTPEQCTKILMNRPTVIHVLQYTSKYPFRNYSKSFYSKSVKDYTYVVYNTMLGLYNLLPVACGNCAGKLTLALPLPFSSSKHKQETQLSLRDRATRACQLKSGKVLHKCRRLVFEKV